MIIYTKAMIDPQEEESLESGQFPVTRWSLVIGAQDGDDESRTRALSELCELYWYPLYAYVRRRGLSAADAEDATQGFFCELLAKDRVQLFSEEKGKLRAYLLSSIKNYLKDMWKAAGRQKRGGGQMIISIEGEMAEERYGKEPVGVDTPEKLFEIRWALTVLDRVFDRVKAEYERLGKVEAYEALKGLLAGDRDVSFREVGEQLGMNEGAARVTLFRMRKLYQRYLKEEIAETLSEDESIEDEIRYLNQVFAS